MFFQIFISLKKNKNRQPIASDDYSLISEIEKIHRSILVSSCHKSGFHTSREFQIRDLQFLILMKPRDLSFTTKLPVFCYSNFLFNFFIKPPFIAYLANVAISNPRRF